jgi:long-chain acyl-CoA synthetase
LIDDIRIRDLLLAKPEDIVGEIIDGRYLKITDRKKELFKTSGGKYVAPQPIENKMKESPFVEQIMLVGDNRIDFDAKITKSSLDQFVKSAIA